MTKEQKYFHNEMKADIEKTINKFIERDRKLKVYEDIDIFDGDKFLSESIIKVFYPSANSSNISPPHNELCYFKVKLNFNEKRIIFYKNTKEPDTDNETDKYFICDLNKYSKSIIDLKLNEFLLEIQ